MALRIALCGLLGLLLLSGCGDDDAPPSVPSEDAGMDSGEDKPPKKDAGDTKPDAEPAADSGRDSGDPEDSGTDSGPPPPVDGGPGDVAIDAGPPPEGWKCAAALWADGYCDCGCSIADFDCVGQNCTARGCVQTGCDACYTEEYGWKPCQAEPDPDDWTCTMAEQLDTVCDCGCGIPDPGCHGSGCSEPGCWRKACNVRHGGDGSVLNDPFPGGASSWTCPAAAWGGGDGCDCGCGAVDPDCNNEASCSLALCNATACRTCHDASGRTVRCDDDLKDGWKCDPQRYGTGDGCDCGCGIADPDCNGDGCNAYGCRDDACKRCTDSDYALDRLVGCTPTSGWSCDEGHYGTGDGCDCGCGVADPDCAGDGCSEHGCQKDKCEYCHAGNSPDPRSDSDYILCDPPGDAKGWTCGSASDPAWANGECDCGCGRPDPYCRLNGRRSCSEAGCKTATCEFCNSASGARESCPDPKWSTSGTCKNPLYGMDGVCDCGCGAIDPDCGDGEGCADSLCAGKGCEVCHGPSNLLAACQTWTCATAAYGDGEVCDCGCGAPDPDCSGLGCSEPGCSDEMCSDKGCHDPYGRIVPCP
jgi:hypothetical protein